MTIKMKVMSNIKGVGKSVGKEKKKRVYKKAKVKKRRTKCRSCKYYIRVKKGLWQEPDWVSKAGHCKNENFLFCKWAYNITGGRDLYEPREDMIIK